MFIFEIEGVNENNYSRYMRWASTGAGTGTGPPKDLSQLRAWVIASDFGLLACLLCWCSWLNAWRHRRAPVPSLGLASCAPARPARRSNTLRVLLADPYAVVP